MKHAAWTKRKSALTLTLCAIIATSTIIILQNTKTTQAALIDPHPGLVGWWRFDEGTGNTAKDSSQYGNDGTIYGTPTWVNGKYGKALSFDGANNYVNCGNSSSLDLTSALTVSCWISVPSPLTGWVGIVSKYQYATGKGGYQIVVTSKATIKSG